MIVDIFGFGDEKEEKENDVEDKMWFYFLNVLVFVFVVNVLNVGGVKIDRVLSVKNLYI